MKPQCGPPSLSATAATEMNDWKTIRAADAARIERGN
jgi:hypothetical protein